MGGGDGTFEHRPNLHQQWRCGAGQGQEGEVERCVSAVVEGGDLLPTCIQRVDERIGTLAKHSLGLHEPALLVALA